MRLLRGWVRGMPRRPRTLPTMPRRNGPRTTADLVRDRNGRAMIDANETVRKTVECYLEQLDDPGEVDAQDLADNVVTQLQRAGWMPVVE